MRTQQRFDSEGQIAATSQISVRDEGAVIVGIWIESQCSPKLWASFATRCFVRHALHTTTGWKPIPHSERDMLVHPRRTCFSITLLLIAMT